MSGCCGYSEAEEWQLNALSIMRSPRSTTALFIVMICLVSVYCMPAVNALKISNIRVDPQGPLLPDTTVNVSFQVDFSADGDKTFPEASEIEFSTDLTRVTWDYFLVLDGIEYEQPRNSGRILSISGGVLSYPEENSESLNIHMQGKAPAVEHTMNKTIFRIQQWDCHGLPLKLFEYNATIVNITDFNQNFEGLQSNLSRFRSHIDEKAAMGVNTTDAEKKYSDADSKLQYARLLISGHYLDQYNSIIAAESAITEGEALLNRAWADKTVAYAEVQLAKANATIDAIHTNLSRTIDKRLNNSYMMRDRAASGIALARDNITQGNFSQAGILAEIASEEADVSRYEALDAEKRMADPLNSLPVPAAIPVIAVLGAGFVILISGRRMRR
jgi:hypothetical protein